MILGDRLAALAGIGLKLQRDAGYFHRGLGCAYLENQIDAHAPADRDRDVLCNGIGESGGLGRDGVDAVAKRRNLIVARVVRRCRGGNSRRIVGNRNARVGDYGSFDVVNGSHQAPIFILGVGIECGENQQKRDRQVNPPGNSTSAFRLAA